MRMKIETMIKPLFVASVACNLYLWFQLDAAYNWTKELMNTPGVEDVWSGYDYIQYPEPDEEVILREVPGHMNQD